jgi:hypothetical protein
MTEPLMTADRHEEKARALADQWVYEGTDLFTGKGEPSRLLHLRLVDRIAVALREADRKARVEELDAMLEVVKELREPMEGHEDDLSWHTGFDDACDTMKDRLAVLLPPEEGNPYLITRALKSPSPSRSR